MYHHLLNIRNYKMVNNFLTAHHILCYSYVFFSESDEIGLYLASGEGNKNSVSHVKSVDIKKILI